MNRAERRRAKRAGMLCEHGHVMKTDGSGTPLCPHGCGFPNFRATGPYFRVDGQPISDDGGEVVYRGDMEGVIDISNGVPPKLGPTPPRSAGVPYYFTVTDVVYQPEEGEKLTLKVFRTPVEPTSGEDIP